jgi:hypothetical protein
MVACGWRLTNIRHPIPAGIVASAEARRTADKVLAIASEGERDFESTPREDVAAVGLAGGLRHTAAG